MRRNEELVKAVLEKAQDLDGRKRLTCGEAFEIARELGVEPIEIGRICNRHNVRICRCQLGCFA